MTLASFIGPKGSAPGVGLQAVQRARSAGFSDDMICQMALEESLFFGPKAKETLGIDDRAAD